MKKSKIFIFSTLLLSAIIIFSVKYYTRNVPDKTVALVTNMNSETSGLDSQSDFYEDSIPTIKVDSNISADYNSLDKLKSNADIVVQGEVLEQSYFDRNEATFTKSRVKVIKSLQGDIQEGTIINIVEPGGITTQEAILKYSHFEEKFGTKAKIDKNSKVKVEFGEEPTLVKGDQAILFAKNEKDFFNDDVYCILGTYYGKVLVKDNKIEKMYINSSDMNTTADLEKKIK